MAQVVNRGVNIYIESGEAEKALERLTTKEKKLNEELAKTSDPKRIKALKTELDKLSEPIDRATKKVKGELAPSFRDLETATRKYLNEFKKTGDPAILAQYAKFNAELSKQKALITDLEKGNKELTSKGIFSGAFWGNLAAQGIERIASFVQGAVQQGVQWALQIEAVQTAFNRINKPNLLNDLREATKGTVSDLELMKRAISADNFQIPLENLATLLEFAQRRARETGQSVDYLVDSIVTGIARKSPLILDNLGINIQRINAEFQKTGDFAKAAFKVVNEELEKAGPYLETNADKVDRLKVSWQNFWTDVGAGIVSTFDNIKTSIDASIDGEAVVKKLQEQELAKTIASERQFELKLIQDYNTKFAQADAAGREKIIAQVKGEIATTEMLRKDATDNGLQQEANKYAGFLDLWNKFLTGLQGGAAGKQGNTLSALNDQLKNLNDQLNNAQIGSDQFKGLQKEIAAIQKQIDDATGKTIKASSKTLKKENDELKRSIEEQRKLAEELDRIAASLLPDGLQKDLGLLDERYQELRRRAKGNSDNLNRIEELYQIERNRIIDKYAKEAKEKYEKLDKEQKDRILKIAAEANQQLAQALANGADLPNRNRLAAAELAVITSAGRAKLAADKTLLDEQERQELQKKDLTEQEKLLIEEKYRQLRSQKETEYLQQLVGEIAGYAQQALNIYSQFAQARTNQENAELARDKRINDTKKDNLQRQLNANLITQKQYNAAIAKIDAEQEKRQREIQLRQFRRQQRADIAQAIINGALAVTSTLSAKPGALDILSLGAFRAIQIGLAVATTAAQIATIASQKPAFARGGKLGGRSHSNGGNPILDGATGQQIAEIEAGEGIINKKTMADNNVYTFTGTPNQIASRMNAMHGGIDWASTGTITPAFRSYSAPMFNYGGMISSLQRKYAAGGTFGGGGAVNDDLVKTIKTLNAILAGGIPAYMLLTQNEIQQGRLYAIRKDAQL